VLGDKRGEEKNMRKSNRVYLHLLQRKGEMVRWLWEQESSSTSTVDIKKGGPDFNCEKKKEDETATEDHREEDRTLPLFEKSRPGGRREKREVPENYHPLSAKYLWKALFGTPETKNRAREHYTSYEKRGPQM